MPLLRCWHRGWSSEPLLPGGRDLQGTCAQVQGWPALLDRMQHPTLPLEAETAEPAAPFHAPGPGPARADPLPRAGSGLQVAGLTAQVQALSKEGPAAAVAEAAGALALPPPLLLPLPQLGQQIQKPV